MVVFKEEILRKIVKFLSKQPEVSLIVGKRNKYLHVSFTDGMIEYWSYHFGKPTWRYHVIPTKHLYPFDNRWPEFRCQFSRTADDPEYDKKGKYFLYTYKYLSEFQFCNRRVFLHRLIYDLVKEGYVDLWFPDSYIKNKLHSLSKLDWSQLRMQNKVYRVIPRFAGLARDITYLQDITQTIKPAWNALNINYVIHRLYNRKKSISRANIVWQFRRLFKAFIYLGHPIGLAALLKDQFKYRPIINRTNHGWVDMAITLAVGTEPDIDRTGKEVYVTTKKLSTEHPQVILGGDEGEYTIMDSKPTRDNILKVRILPGK